MTEFKTITADEIEAGFINRELVDYQDSIRNGTNKEGIAQANSDLFDVFASMAEDDKGATL